MADEGVKEPVIVPAPVAGIVDGKVPPVDTNAVPPVEKTKEEFIAEKAAADKKVLDDAEAIKKAADEAAATEREGWQKEYVKIDNEDAQAAIDLMNESNVSPVEANAIFAKAIESKDLKDVDWATLEAKIGPAKTRLVKNGIDKYFNDVVVVQEATTKAAYDVMGGEANWVKVKDWAQAREKADPAYGKRVSEYRKAIDAGGFSAEAAVKALKADYEGDAKNGGLGQSGLLRGDTAPAGSGSPMGRAEYLAAVKKAEFERAPAAAIEALHNRRRAGMKAGI